MAFFAVVGGWSIPGLVLGDLAFASRIHYRRMYATNRASIPHTSCSETSMNAVHITAHPTFRDDRSAH